MPDETADIMAVPTSTHPSGDDRLLGECPYCAAPPNQWCLTSGGNYSSQLHATRGLPAQTVKYGWHEECDGPICPRCDRCACEGGCNKCHREEV